MLQSSAPISAQDINEELGRSATAAFDINGTAERALAGKSSGAISFSDFLGKSAQISDTFTKTSSASWSQSINLGTAVTGRRIVVVVFYTFNATSPVTNTGVTIGTTDVSGDSHGSFAATGDGNAVWIGSGTPTGATATIALTWSAATAGRVVIFSMAAGSEDDSNFASGDRTAQTGDSLAVDNTSGGILITAYNSNSSFSSISETGVDWIKAYTEGVVGFKKLTATANGVAVAWSGTSQDHPTFFAQSYLAP